jgi:3-oxoacyl-[acyl-carrier-protein] synthase II
VVITGVGICSPIGNSLEACDDNLRAMNTGIVQMDEWKTFGQLGALVAGLVNDVDFKQYPRKRVRTMGRVALLAAFASEKAVEDAGISPEELNSGRVGVTHGSTHGSSSVLEKYCRTLFANNSFKGAAGSDFLKFMSHTTAANLAEYFGIRGRVQPTCSACTSGSQAIGLAYEYVREGLQDVMICGGAEEMHITHAGVFDIMYAASRKYNETPDLTPRPFDAKRDGVVVGEGAATLIVEPLDRARARGAKIYAEIIGYGTSCDGIHLTNPSYEGMGNCMQLALDSAGITSEEVDYVNAHGTATELGDIAESKATYEVLGERVPVSTQKSYTGHTLGACGAIESVYSLAMMAGNYVAPNRTLDEVDERCAPLNYVVKEPQMVQLDTIMNNNFAFGGINTSLIYRRL